MRRSLHTLIAAATLLTVATPVSDHASAAPLENGKYHEEFNFVGTDFCGVAGLSVEFDVVVDGHVLTVLRGPGRFPLFQDGQHGVARLTNLASGASMTIQWDSIGKDVSITDNGDGTTLTIVTKSVGHFSFRDGGGTLVGLDAGGYWSEFLYDNAGTPSDPSDDTVTFIGDTKVFGREDSDHADSCPFTLSIIG